MNYPSGLCPNCKKDVTPRKCIADNTLRRDVFECPQCATRILPCRAPGCKNFALGRKDANYGWDDEFCPDCKSSAAKNFGKLAVTIVSGIVVKLFTKGK